MARAWASQEEQRQPVPEIRNLPRADRRQVLVSHLHPRRRYPALQDRRKRSASAMIVKYQDYKRYEGKSTIKYGDVVDENKTPAAPHRQEVVSLASAPPSSAIGHAGVRPRTCRRAPKSARSGTRRRCIPVAHTGAPGFRHLHFAYAARHRSRPKRTKRPIPNMRYGGRRTRGTDVADRTMERTHWWRAAIRLWPPSADMWMTRSAARNAPAHYPRPAHAGGQSGRHAAQEAREYSAVIAGWRNAKP